MAFLDAGAAANAPAVDPNSLNGNGEALAPANEEGTTRDQRDLHQKLLRWADPRQTINIADEVEETKLAELGVKGKREAEIDDASRDTWVKQSEDAVKLAMQVAEKKEHPWPNSSNVIFPLVTVAAIQFAARAYPSIIDGRRVVKGVVVGPDAGTPEIATDGTPAMQMRGGQWAPIWKIEPGEKRRRADRIGEHMSWQLIEEQTEWEEETDKLVHILPIAGCCFRKTYFDPGFARNMSVLVSPLNLIVNYWAKSMETAPRVTELIKLYPHEVEEKIRAELFLKGDYFKSNTDGDDDAPIEFFEQHRRADLDGDGYAEPYIVTLHKETGKIARIVARYDPEGIMVNVGSGTIVRVAPVHYYTKYDFIPNQEGGIYGIGFGQLLRPLNDSINTAINQLFDAGTKSIMGGGFIGRGLSMHGGAVKFKMGEFKPVNAPGAAIRDSIVQLTFPEPSNVLFSLLGLLIEAGKEVASVKEVLMGGPQSANMQPTTLLALIEQGLKVFTGIYKRVHRSLKKEYDKLERLNRLYLDEQASYRVGDEWRTITRADYERGSGVAPVSDPSMVSDMQKLARAQFLQGYQNDPYCDPLEARRRIFDAASIEDADKLLRQRQGPDPALMLKAREVQYKEIAAKAGALADMTKAVLNLAEAGATNTAEYLDYVRVQLDAVRQRMERLDEPEGGSAGKAGDIGQGGEPSAVPGMAQPSGDAALSAVPA